MNSLTTKKLIRFLPIFLWLIIVFFLSSQNGEETAELSGGMARWLKTYIFRSSEIGTLNYILRRSAHFVLYFICGFLMIIGVKGCMRKNVYIISIASASVLAIIDEVHKIPIPGRHCDVLEIGLNILGVIAGTAAFWLVELMIGSIIEKRDL